MNEQRKKQTNKRENTQKDKQHSETLTKGQSRTTLLVPQQGPLPFLLQFSNSPSHVHRQVRLTSPLFCLPALWQCDCRPLSCLSLGLMRPSAQHGTTHLRMCTERYGLPPMPSSCRPLMNLMTAGAGCHRLEHSRGTGTGVSLTWNMRLGFESNRFRP